MRWGRPEEMIQQQHQSTAHSPCAGSFVSSQEEVRKKQSRVWIQTLVPAASWPWVSYLASLSLFFRKAGTCHSCLTEASGGQDRTAHSTSHSLGHCVYTHGGGHFTVAATIHTRCGLNQEVSHEQPALITPLPGSGVVTALSAASSPHSGPLPLSSHRPQPGRPAEALSACTRKKCERESRAVVLTLRDPVDCSPPGSPAHGISWARILGVGCHFLLRGFFLTQGSNLRLLCLLHCRQALYHQCHLGSPRTRLPSSRCGIKRSRNALGLLLPALGSLSCSLIGLSALGVSLVSTLYAGTSQEPLHPGSLPGLPLLHSSSPDLPMIPFNLASEPSRLEVEFS